MSFHVAGSFRCPSQRFFSPAGRYGEATYVPSSPCTRSRSSFASPRWPSTDSTSTANPTQMTTVLTPTAIVVTTNTNDAIPTGRFITRYASAPSRGGFGLVPSRSVVVVMAGLLRRCRKTRIPCTDGRDHEEDRTLHGGVIPR